MSEPEPLTADELATLRGAYDRHGIPDHRWFGRLLATLDTERAALSAHKERGLDAERLARAMRACDGVNWPKGWHTADFDWVARQVAAEYRALGVSEAVAEEEAKDG